MNITNPFVTSGYVSPHYFCDRVEETSLLTRALTINSCTIWNRGLPGDRRYYASIANLILLPRALAKLTDHNDEVKKMLRYEVFKRFGFKPEEQTDDPEKPKNYNNYVWRS